MPWTRQKPTRIGWYWWRNNNRPHKDERGPFAVKVRYHGSEVDDRLAIGNCTLDGSHFLRGEWQGPIEPEE